MHSTKKRIVVSPQQFAILCSELILLEMAGHNPMACTIEACKAAGIEPPNPFESAEIVLNEEAA